MGLKEQINDDMKDAMRAKDAGKVSTLRMLRAEIQRKELDVRMEPPVDDKAAELTDAHVLAIVEKMIKQRKDSISQFEAGGRADLADIEKAELEVLTGYMPAGLSDEQIAAEVAAAVAESGAAGPQDMGKVMAIVKPKMPKGTDMGAVSALIKKALQPA